MSGPMRRASRSPTPKWKPSTSAATRSILNGTTPSTRVRKNCSSYFCGSTKSYRDLPAIMCEQIAHFFQHYKDLEKGKCVTIVRWLDAEAAEQLVMDAIARGASG